MYAYLSANSTADNISGPAAVIAVGLFLAVVILIGGAMAMIVELRKTKILAGQEEALRQLVGRYEQLAENTLDAQQRVAADVSELRSRTSSIEKILRTVD
jgi:hypothetical protein